MREVKIVVSAYGSGILTMAAVNLGLAGDWPYCGFESFLALLFGAFAVGEIRNLRKETQP